MCDILAQILERPAGTIRLDTHLEEDLGVDSLALVQTQIGIDEHFDLATPDILGVRAVYDRGALVALPPETRALYVDHMLRIIPEHAHILLITLEYDQEQVQGPPHSVPEAEVRSLYEARCRVECIESVATAELPPKFAEAGIDEAVESVYHIIKDQ